LADWALRKGILSPSLLFPRLTFSGSFGLVHGDLDALAAGFFASH
jgi:hypothetical protein